jgi:Domain of unknown function (DUF5591)
MTTEIRFDRLRDDWYRANQLMPRLFRKAIRRDEQLVFAGFPRQWIPLFEYFDLSWKHCRNPGEYIPIISKMSNRELAGHCKAARETGTLRELVESVVTLDPVLADFLYILDNTMDYRNTPTKQDNTVCSKVKLTNWQSYGRQEIKELLGEIDKIRSAKTTAVVLPCSRRRPYGASRTHHKVWQQLAPLGVEAACVHQIVITSLAVVPDELWNHPIVLRYDGGVPDIYRILQLSRRYFSRNRYHQVIDCLHFRPYSDVLRILAIEGTISELRRGPIRASRQFYVRT